MARDLQPGKRYKVLLEDCCIRGELYGTFIERITDGEDESESDYRFDIGIIGPCWGAWETEEV